jgi:uncharacterized membrane protein YciS (DUF1049 family)
MTSESDFDSYSPRPDPPVRRPALYPLFVIPVRVANVAGVALVGSAALAMIGALIEALTYHAPSLSQEGLLGPNAGITEFGQPANSFADRLALFTSGGGANMTLATLLVVAVAVIAMAARGREADEELFGWWRLVLSTAAVLATFVALANLGMCVEVVRNVSGEFIAQDSANKLSSVVGFLAPITLSAGVVLYAVLRLRSSIPSEPVSRTLGINRRQVE